MTIIGWLQIAFIFALVLICVAPLGLFMARVFDGERTFLTPVLGPVERGFYRAAGIDPRTEQGWLAYTLAMLAFNAIGFALALRAACGLQAVLPLNPQGFGAVRDRSRVQHRDQLRHQHQLAVLWRRNHHEPSRPDGGPHGAELPVGGDRHRAGDRGDARLRAHAAPRRSAISGSI